MKKRISLLLACVTALGVLLSSCGNSSTGEGVMSDFATTDLDGNAVDESIFSGYSLTMVNVWATFCTPCLSEMPDLGELAQEYQDRGVQIVGLVSDTLDMEGALDQAQVDTAVDIVAQTKASYPHLLPSQDLFGLLSQITSVPTTFFVNSEGEQVGNAYLGAKSKEDWETIIEQTLAEV